MPNKVPSKVPSKARLMQAQPKSLNTKIDDVCKPKLDKKKKTIKMYETKILNTKIRALIRQFFYAVWSHNCVQKWIWRYENDFVMLLSYRESNTMNTQKLYMYMYVYQYVSWNGWSMKIYFNTTVMTVYNLSSTKCRKIEHFLSKMQQKDHNLLVSIKSFHQIEHSRLWPVIQSKLCNHLSHLNLIFKSYNTNEGNERRKCSVAETANV